MVENILNKLPNVAPDGPLESEKKGILSPVGDPLGQGLKQVTKPVGHLTGAVGRPSGEALLEVERRAKEDHGYIKEDSNKPDKDLPGGERIGGSEQTGKNPLGL